MAQNDVIDIDDIIDQNIDYSQPIPTMTQIYLNPLQRQEG